MLNNKIKRHLKKKSARSSHAGTDAILGYLNTELKIAWTPKEIGEKLGLTGGSLYPVLYRLARLDKIGFACREYHDFDAEPYNHDSDFRNLSRRMRIMVWQKDLDIQPRVLAKWATAPQPVVVDPVPNPQTPTEEQPPLFGVDLGAMTSDDLSNLIEQAKKEQVSRGVDRRYSCLSKEDRGKVAAVFAKFGVSDPVYLAHSDESISFLTYTAVQSMPLDIVIDMGEGAKRVSAKHITLFGAQLIANTDSMFSGGTP